MDAAALAEGAVEGVAVGGGVRLGVVVVRPVAAAVVVRPDFDFSKTSYSFNTHMQAADAAELQAVTAAAAAWHLLPSCWQMKSEMTPMFSAEPWLKSVWSTAAKASDVFGELPVALLVKS